MMQNANSSTFTTSSSALVKRQVVYCSVPRNRVPKEGQTSQKRSAYKAVRREGPKGHLGIARQADQPTEQMSIEQPREARLPSNLPAEQMFAEQPSEARLPINLPTKQPSVVRQPSNLHAKQTTR